MSKLKYGVGDEVWVKVKIENVDKRLTSVLPYFVGTSAGNHWWVSKDEILSHPSSAPPSSNTFNVEVGDIVVLDNDIRTQVHLVGDTSFFSEEYAEDFNLSEIKAIYKQTWKKEKTLEDMSREELIARIKQLEQGE